MSYDMRVNTPTELIKAFEELSPFNRYILEVVYQDGETAQTDELPRRPGLQWIYSEIIIKNNELNDCQASRVRLYNATDPRHALLSFSVELLERTLKTPEGYDPRAPRIAHTLGDQETKTNRLQILMRPSIKKELKRQAELHGQSMSEVIDSLVCNWIANIQATN